MNGTLWLGFAFALAAAFCYEVGYAVQALEARRAPEHHALRPSLIGYLINRPIWLAATVLSLIGWPLQILALANAPLTLVQPTLALGLLLLLALGVRLLGEPVGRREVLAVTIIVAAVGTIAWAGPRESGEVPRDLALAITLGALGLVALAPYGASLLRSGRRPVALLIAGAGAADALAAFVAKLVAEDASAGAWATVILWVAIVATVVILGVISETTALQRSAATRVAPAVLVIQIAVPIVLAPLVGGEGWSQTPLGGAVLVAAVAALAVGVGLLGSSPAVADVIAERPDGEGEPQAEGAGATQEAG